MSSPRRAALVAAVALLPLLGACGSGDDETAVAIAQLDEGAVPRSILELVVEQEDVRERIADTERPYVKATGLYTLREGERLQGTLQVSRFNDDVDVTDHRFRMSIVNQIGSTDPKAFRMGGEIVYLTASKRQAVAVFFEERSLVVLSTLETFEQSRSLLREVMELDL